MAKFLCSCALAALLLLVPSTAALAEPPFDARTDRLSGLSSKDLLRLGPYAEQGPVALVEFADTDADELPAINVVSQVEAPIDTVLAVIENPDAYPTFMHTLDRVETLSRKKDSRVYDWGWDLSVFRLRGRNILRVYRSPAGSTRGHRVTIDSVSGDFGTGRMSLRLLPVGDKRTQLIISLRLDLRHANYVARQAATAARSVNRSANMSLAFAMTFGLGREAERRAGHTREHHTQAPLRKPAVNEGAIFPLLMRGDLVFLSMNGDDLSQVAIYGRINHPQPEVRSIMLNAQDFGAALVPGSKAEVVETKGAATTFAWEIDIPLLGVEGEMRMYAGEPTISIHATKGALDGGTWEFEARPVGPHVTLVSAWARFDVSKTNFLVRAITNADPYLAHGISAASQVMLMRALRTRARNLAMERLQEERRQRRLRIEQQQAADEHANAG